MAAVPLVLVGRRARARATSRPRCRARRCATPARSYALRPPARPAPGAAGAAGGADRRGAGRRRPGRAPRCCWSAAAPPTRTRTPRCARSPGCCRRAGAYAFVETGVRLAGRPRTCRRAGPAARRWARAGSSSRRTSCSTGCCRDRVVAPGRARSPPSTRELDVRVAGVPRRLRRSWPTWCCERYREALHGDIRMNCDTCAYRVLLPGFEDKRRRAADARTTTPTTRRTATATATAGARALRWPEGEHGAVPGRASTSPAAASSSSAAGTVAQRRLTGLLAAGADVEVVSPEVTPASRRWRPRASCAGPPARYRDGDLDGAWYAIACTDDPARQRRGGRRGGARAGCSACAPTTPRRAARSPRPSAGTTGSPSGCSPAGRPAARPRCAPRWWRRCRPGWSTDTAEPVRPGVALVGGGPGDPELITVRGRRLLARADVVVTDRLGPRDLLDELGPHVEVIDASKIPYGRAMNQARINELLIDARPGGPVRGPAQGRRPVRLRPRLRGGPGLRRGGRRRSPWCPA